MEENRIGNGVFKVLSFEDLIHCKELSGRPKDLLDILELRNVRQISDNLSKGSTNT